MERIDIELGILEPWHIENTKMVPSSTGGNSEMHIWVSYEDGLDFPCPVCGKDCAEDDQADRTWINESNYFPVIIHASVPLIYCKKDGFLEVEVPWTADKYGFRQI